MTSNAIPTLAVPIALPLPTRLAMPGPVRILLLLTIVAALLRIVAMFRVPLVPEEAYYWMYAQHPNLSYFDHPPMVSWVIGAGTAMFGNTEFGVRFVGHLLMLGTSLLVYHYGRMWYSRTAGIVAALAVQILPVFYGVGFIATMDSALMFFWIACLVCLSHVLLRGRSWCWYPAGLALGGAMLSKYTGVFLVAGTGLALILHRPWRRQFLSVHPYLAILLGAAAFSPVVIWNWQHDWASFRFQFMDRFDPEPLQLKTVTAFLGFQLLIFTPVFLFESLRLVVRTLSSWRRLQRPRWLLMVCFSVPLVAVMSYKSLRYQIHLNWTLPVFLALIPALTQFLLMRSRLPGRTPGRRRPAMHPFVTTAIICAAFNIAFMTYLLTLQHHMQWLSPFGQWPELAVIVEEHEDALEAETGREPLIIASGKYRLASVLAFYRNPIEDDRGAIRNTTSQWRLDLGDGLAFPYWADTASWRGADCLIVVERNKPELLESIRSQFDRVDIIDDPRLRRLSGGFAMAIGRGLRDLPQHPAIPINTHGDP